MTSAKNEGIDINNVGPTEIIYSIAWTNQHAADDKQKYSQI